MLQKLPAVVTLKKHLTSCLNVHGKNFHLNTSLMGYYYGSSLLAGGLIWGCSSYCGFLVSALGQLKIPSFVNNQFLLANASPDLKTAFANTWQPLNSPPQTLFHSTTFERLHAILCQGLRVQSGTSLQCNGAYHGNGIHGC